MYNTKLIKESQYKIYNRLRKSLEMEANDDLCSSTDTGIDRSDSIKEQLVTQTPIKVKSRPKSRIATGIMSNEAPKLRPITLKKELNKNDEMMESNAEEYATFNDGIHEWNKSLESAGYQDFISKKKEIQDLSPRKLPFKETCIKVEVAPIYQETNTIESVKQDNVTFKGSSSPKKEVRFDSAANKRTEVETRVKTNIESQKRPSPLKSGWSGEIEKAKDSKSLSDSKTDKDNIQVSEKPKCNI